jgi:hypothetical protein
VSARKRSRRFARYDHRNPTKNDYVVAGVGIVVAAGLGYWIYSQSQLNQTASTSGGGGGSSGGSASPSNTFMGGSVDTTDTTDSGSGGSGLPANTTTYQSGSTDTLSSLVSAASQESNSASTELFG